MVDDGGVEIGWVMDAEVKDGGMEVGGMKNDCIKD